MTGTQKVEMKLENGVQTFTASEVAHLLNEIRIYKYLYEKEKGNK